MELARNFYSCGFNLGKFLLIVAPVMGVSIATIVMLQRLLQDYMTKEAAALNARRRLIFSKTASSLSEYCSQVFGSKGEYSLDKEQEQSLLKTFVAYFSYMIHSFGTINTLKVIMFSRDGPLRKREVVARIPVRADNRWFDTSRSP